MVPRVVALGIILVAFGALIVSFITTSVATETARSEDLMLLQRTVVQECYPGVHKEC